MRWRTLREWFRPRPAVSAARYVQNTIPKWDKSHFIADYRRPSRAQWRTSWTLPRRSENTVNVQTLMWYFVIIVELRRGENVNYSNIQLTVLTSICLFPADCSTAAPLLTSTSAAVKFQQCVACTVYPSLIVASILLEREEESTIFVTFQRVKLLKLFTTNTTLYENPVRSRVWLGDGLA